MIPEIRKMMMKARFEKDSFKSNLLSTLIAEAVMVGKNDGNRETTEAEVTAVVKKFLKGVNENIKLLEELGKDKTGAIREKEILESLLPAQLSEEELQEIVSDIVNDLPERSPKMMGKVMSQLKKDHDGRYDAKKASEIVKKYLLND